MKNKTRSAFIVIDMENGFIDASAPHCIRNAAATVPALIKTIDAARSFGIPIFFVKRIYRANGCDVELTRYQKWRDGGKAMTPASEGPNSAMAPEGLRPLPGDYTIIKPRWSAFFQTELDLILRRLGVRNVILTGTTTPNCVRTSAYDANSLDYNVVIIEDCCSSQTEEIQRVNIEDMRRMGAVILDSNEFIKDYIHCPIVDLAAKIRDEIEKSGEIPEDFDFTGKESGWKDKW
ncbi:MAG: cysteine hydrolase [Lachnospiraceae bacterium]|nr:cysteine hydrolase [Lachnospiraceae bacterium]